MKPRDLVSSRGTRAGVTFGRGFRVSTRPCKEIACFLVVFVVGNVAAAVAHFVSFEVGDFINALVRLRAIARMWHWAVIAVIRIETVIYVAVELGGAVKPGANANENPARKPFRAVVAVGSTRVRSVVIVAVRASGLDPNGDADLGICFRSGDREEDSSNSG